jgi:alpha-ribazole phosphatase
MTPDARVLLVRHAEPQRTQLCHGAVSDPGLSDSGTSAATLLSPRLRALGHELGGITRLLTSPARRAVETVAEVAVALNLTPTVDARWRERHFGAWEGHPWSDLWPTVPRAVLEDHAAYAAFTPPQAETPSDVATRVEPALAEALRGAGVTVVLTHAGAIRQCLAEALQVDLATALRIDVPYARMVVIGRINDSLIVERVGV